MTAAPTVVVCADVATEAASRLVAALAEAQALRGTACVVVPGGTIGIEALAAVRSVPTELDWRRVDVWWGDERFVPADSSDRNERQAREALLDHLDLDPARVHPMAAAPGDATSPGSASPGSGSPGAADAGAADAGAAAYAAALEGATFDVLILGMGPEGHTASIFPFSPAATDTRAAFAVYDCPKPPPTRISMSFATIQSARAVWVLATGSAKASALAQAYAGAPQEEIPVAGARGVEQTLWLLDEAAASQLPV